LTAEAEVACVLECASPSCYGGVYATEPLEDGEIDTVRAKKFLDCFHRQRRTERERRKAEL